MGKSTLVVRYVLDKLRNVTEESPYSKWIDGDAGSIRIEVYDSVNQPEHNSERDEYVRNFATEHDEKSHILG